MLVANITKDHKTVKNNYTAIQKFSIYIDVYAMNIFTKIFRHNFNTSENF